MHSRNRCNELSLVSAQKVYNLFLLDFFDFDIFQITTFESIYEIGRCIRLGFFFYPALALFEQANCYTNIYYIFSVTEIYFFLVHVLSFGNLAVIQFTSCWQKYQMRHSRDNYIILLCNAKYKRRWFHVIFRQDKNNINSTQNWGKAQWISPISQLLNHIHINSIF
jgi:hypothetical protein